MASQGEGVEGEQTETTAAADEAEFSKAWNQLEAEESGQPDDASGRQDDDAGSGNQAGDEAGQGEAQAGQPAASTSPDADAGSSASRGTSDDVWASADPKLREAHENALKASQEQARKAENLARSNGGRLAKALNELNALRTAPSGESADETDRQRKERLEGVRKDYPDVAEPILEELANLRSKVDGLTTSATARAESDVQTALQDEYVALLDKHSDTGEIIKAPEYAAWLQGQPPAIQRIVQENAKAVVSAADTAVVFDKFKAETGWGRGDGTAREAANREAQRRAGQLDAGRSVTGTQPGVSSDTRTGDGSFGDEWDRLDAKDRRKVSGRK